MAIPSLTGSYIDETFQRLVQTNNTRTEFADGLGNPITLGPPGSVNPTPNYLPFNNAGVFADSYLNQTSSILKTTSASIDKGLYLNFASNFYKLGNNSTGVSVDLANQIYQFGDYDYGGASGTNIFIDDTTSIIKTRYNGSSTDKGLYLDFAANSYTLGDPAGNIITVSSNSSDNSTLTLANGFVTFTADDEININSNSTVVLNGAGGTYVKQLTSTPQLNVLTINTAAGQLYYTASAALITTASHILGGKATHIPFFKTDTTLATSSIFQSGSTSIIINTNLNTIDNPEALYVYQPHPTSINVISGIGDLNNYLQLNIQNASVDNNASSDVVATANNGDENGNYIDMGINGSGFSGLIGGANDAYLYTTGSYLHIGNATPNKSIQFFAGGLDVDASRKLQLNANNKHEITGSLNISNSLNVINYITSSGILTNGNNTILGNTVMSGSSTIQGTTTMTGSLLITGSTTQIGNNTLLGNTTLSGSIVISGSIAPGNLSASVNIFGDTAMSGFLRFNPYSTNIDNNISASYIYVSGSTNDLYFTQNGAGYNNTTRLRWLEGNLYTGLLNGGLITTQSSTVYQVQSGSGIIVNLNASLKDNPYPTIQYVNWPNLSSSIAPLSTLYDQQFVAVNNAGQIFAQGVPYNDGDYNTKMPIGIVIHQNRSTINAVQTFPSVAYGWKQRSFDFIKAFGPLKISGYTLRTSSSLGLLLDGGTAWVDGRNYIVDPNNPSYINEAVGIATSKIYYYHQSGSSFVYDTNAGAGYPNITASLYSNNGTLTSVPTNDWTIQRVYYFPNSATKAFYIYFGNAHYANKDLAIAAIQTEAFSEAPNTAANAIFVGYMLLKQGGTFGNIDDYEFRAGGLFRGGGTSGAGGSSGGGTSGVTQLLAGTNVVISPTAGTGIVTVNALPISSGNATTSSYGSFYSTQTQTNAGVGTTNSMSLNISDISNGVLISGSSNTKIKILNAGLYDLQFSAQFDRSSGGLISEANVWLSKNGSSVADTNTAIQIPGGNSNETVAAWNWFVNASPNDYYEILWASADPDVRLRYNATPSYGPTIPSLIVTVNRVDIASSNTGSFTGIFSGSFAGTASFSNTASYAYTASYLLGAGPGTFPYTGDAAISGSLVITGSTTSTRGFTGSLFGTSSWAYSASNAESSSYALTAQTLLGSVENATNASSGSNFVITNTLQIQSTLTDYYRIASTLAGLANPIFTKNTGSFTSAFCKYTTSNGTNARAGEFVTVWNGTETTYYDNATTDIGDTSSIVFSSAIVAGQIKILTGPLTPSGWQIKMIATFM